MQAAIAATHARADGLRSVDWPLILELYDQLSAMNPSPVVALNRAVAIAKVRGSVEPLAAVEALVRDAKLHNYYLFLAVQGRLLLDLGRRAGAAACFRAALECRCSSGAFCDEGSRNARRRRTWPAPKSAHAAIRNQ